MRATLRVLMVMLPFPALAQTPAQSVPPQQGLIERVAPVTPPRLGPSAAPPPAPPVTGPGANAQVRVLGTTVQGNTALSAAELEPYLAPLAGRTVTLSQIEDARQGILLAYRRAGYPYVAVNTGLSAVPGGVALHVGVVEGYVAEVRLDGDIGPAGTQAQRFLQRVVDQRPLSESALERALLLASDIPGVAARGTLVPLPGEPGALRLVVALARKPFSGYISADNRGYQLLGPWEVLTVAGLNSFTSLGERTEVDLLEGQGNSQTFGQVSEEFFVGGSGLRVRLYAGAGRAEPGSVLAAIGYNGQTRVAGAAVVYPVIRSRPLNLSVTGMFDMFESEVDTSQTGVSQRSSFDSVRAFRVGADGSLRDTVLAFAPAAATNAASFRLSQGIQAFGASTSSIGSGRAGSNFGFTKINGEVTRNQPLWAPTDNLLIGAEATLAGQWTNDVLPLSEKFYLGGARLGRGFYSGQVTGDKAFGVSIELQFTTGFDVTVPVFDEVHVGTQFYLFRDYGQTWENQAVDPNRQLSSYGAGIRFSLGDHLQFDIEGVHRVTRNPNADGLGAKRLDADAGFGRFVVRY